MRVVLLHLMRSFSLRLTPGQEPLALSHALTLRPAKGLQVTVHRRQ